MRFNPPPDWPRFPNGWTPPPGWQPDPSWPQPPSGWQFWVDAEEPLAPRTPPPLEGEPSPQLPWYRRATTVVLLLIVFAPIGIVLLWLRRDWSVRWRGILTGLASVLFIILLASSNSGAPSDATTTVLAGPGVVGGSAGPTQSAPAASASSSPTTAATSAAAMPSQSTSAATVSQTTSKAAAAAIIAPPRTTAAPATHTTKPAPPPTTATTTQAPSTCGAPANPYHYNLCGVGSEVTNPPSNICSYFSCIDNFWNGHGYMVECHDGMYSLSGGRRGACSYHGGEEQPVYSG